jgi:hypothetical protein
MPEIYHLVDQQVKTFLRVKNMLTRRKLAGKLRPSTRRVQNPKTVGCSGLAPFTADHKAGHDYSQPARRVEIVERHGAKPDR